MMQISAFMMLAFLVSMVASDVSEESSEACMHSGMKPECLSQKGQRALLQVKIAPAHASKVPHETQPASFLDSRHNPAGAAAPLDEHGYASVADCGCPKEMQEFILRAVFDLGLEECAEGGLRGILPYHFSDGRQTYAQLTADLLKGSAETCTPIATVGNCKATPADCPVFEEASTSSSDCMCSVSGASSSKLMFNLATVGQNNLGGTGPDTGAEELRFVNVFGKAADETDLVITTSNAYVPGTSSLTSDMSNGYASLGLTWGTETKFNFKFVVSGSNTPKVLDELHLTFHDIGADPASPKDVHEFLWSSNYKGYIVEPDTSLIAWQSAHDKYTHFSGSAHVAKPTSAGAGTSEQTKASVMFFYDSVSEFSVSFGSTGTSSEMASLLFSGESTFASRCQA